MHRIIHLHFEPVDETRLRAVLFQEDDELGGLMLLDIVEIDARSPRGAKRISERLEDIEAGAVVAMKARWGADLDAQASDDDRVATLCAAYPGAEQCGPMTTLHRVARPVVPF